MRSTIATIAAVGTLAGALAGCATSPTGQRQLLALLGVGAQVGVLLPYSRAQEREADVLGLDVIARAGFDPREAVALWRNMAERGARSGGGEPSEFLSTHPSHEGRIAALEVHMPRALARYEEAGAAGRQPACE